jgi:hypothetical protein
MFQDFEIWGTLPQTVPMQTSKCPSPKIQLTIIFGVCLHMFRAIVSRVAPEVLVVDDSEGAFLPTSLDVIDDFTLLPTKILAVMSHIY